MTAKADVGPRAGPPVLIGLTGPIGCGKSTVAAMLGGLGAVVIDADRLARRATGPGSPTMPAIRERFGGEVLEPDGSLDRAKMAEVVFADPPALAALEAIVHPVVRRMVDAKLAAARAHGVPLAVIEAIKLVEGGLADRCDEVWLIECDPATQRRRLAERGVPHEDAERRLAAQGADLADRLAERLAGIEPAPRVRRFSTMGSLAETRELVEEALADALATGG